LPRIYSGQFELKGTPKLSAREHSLLSEDQIPPAAETPAAKETPSTPAEATVASKETPSTSTLPRIQLSECSIPCDPLLQELELSEVKTKWLRAEAALREATVKINNLEEELRISQEECRELRVRGEEEEREKRDEEKRNKREAEEREEREEEERNKREAEEREKREEEERKKRNEEEREKREEEEKKKREEDEKKKREEDEKHKREEEERKRREEEERKKRREEEDEKKRREEVERNKREEEERRKRKEEENKKRTEEEDEKKRREEDERNKREEEERKKRKEEERKRRREEERKKREEEDRKKRKEEEGEKRKEEESKKRREEEGEKRKEEERKEEDMRRQEERKRKAGVALPLLHPQKMRTIKPRLRTEHIDEAQSKSGQDEAQKIAAEKQEEIKEAEEATTEEASEETAKDELAAQISSTRPDVDATALRTLTNDEVHRLLNATAPERKAKDVIWRGRLSIISRGDLKEIISRGTEITNETLDGLIEVLDRRGGQQKVVCLSSFESEMIVEGQGAEITNDYLLPKIEGLNVEEVVIAQPCCLSGHWTLFVAHGPRSEFIQYNSISRMIKKGENPNRLVGTHECTASKIAGFWRGLLNVEWPLRVDRKGSQRQTAGSNDCGPYVLYWIKRLMENADPTKPKQSKVLHRFRGDLANFLLEDSGMCDQQ